MRIHAAAAVSLTLIGALTACGSGAIIPKEDQISLPPETSRPPVHKAEPKAPARTTADHIGLKDRWTFKNGVTVRLDTIDRGRSSDAASTDGPVPEILFTVLVDNGSSKSLDMEGFYVECLVGGKPSEQVFDQGLDTPTTHLLAGRKVAFRTACTADSDARDFQVEINPDLGDWDANPAIFVGRVA